MAAIIIALKKSRTSIMGGQGKDDVKKVDLRNMVTADFDESGNGRLEFNELKNNLGQITVRADILLERLQLEKDLSTMLTKFPCFCMNVLSFLMALLIINPAGKLAVVHEHIEESFHLAAAYDVKDFDGVWHFTDQFRSANDKFQATSHHYWCEHRYSHVVWDHVHHIPHKECRSPRMAALGLGGPSWSDLASGGGSSSSSGSSSGSHRRLRAETVIAQRPEVNASLLRLLEAPPWKVLAWQGEASDAQEAEAAHRREEASAVTPEARLEAERRRLSGSSSGSSSGASSASISHAGSAVFEPQATNDAPPCMNYDAILQKEMGDYSVTCESQKMFVCDYDVGVKLCPQACGYCSPFTYDPYHIFGKPQVTMMPVMIHQTRFVRGDCHDFAKYYGEQAFNPILNMLPPKDGLRSGPVLQCIDRSQHQATDYALVVPCPAEAPPIHCDIELDNGTRAMGITSKQYLHGHAVYGQFLASVTTEEMLMDVDWLDLQTEHVEMTSMVYTEDIEIFTLLSVKFWIDEAGNIKPSVDMQSYKDIVRDEKDLFLIYLAVTSLGSLFSLVLSVVHLLRHMEDCKWGLALYEMLSRLFLVVYPAILLITWRSRPLMAKNYEELLQSYLHMKGEHAEDWAAVQQEYFEVEDHILDSANWMYVHCIFSNLVVYMQFLQLIFYFSAHPKMAVLTSTINKALSNILHFLLLFGFLFSMLAFMAHWQLGARIKSFATFGTAISSQGRMLFGEFIYASGADELSSSMLIMYWIYAFTFMLLMFFTLLNFFLAIVVDAFAEVMADNAKLTTVKGFFPDIGHTINTFLQIRAHNWLSRKHLADYCETICGQDKNDGGYLKDDEDGDEEDGKRFFNPMDLQQVCEMSEDQICKMLCYYHGLCEVLRKRRPGQQGVQTGTQSSSTSGKRRWGSN